MTTTAPDPAADLAAIKTTQQAMWASGDFAVIGTTLQIVGELLCEAADVGGGERVPDVAAGAEGLHVTFEVADAVARRAMPSHADTRLSPSS